MRVLLALLLFVAFKAEATETRYKPKDFSYLIGMPGFSDSLLKMHFQLYQGYVKQVNYLLDTFDSMKDVGSYQYGALKRRFGWEFDGMRLHELYFENLGGSGQPALTSPLIQEIQKQFQSFDTWKKDFIAVGSMRGVGWSILMRDPGSGKLINVWINEHDTGHLASSNILLVMDVWEHAFIPQFGLDRASYIDTFFKNIDWDVVDSRFTAK
jgi:superoxide dismutase, Fe-Mn family